MTTEGPGAVARWRGTVIDSTAFLGGVFIGGKFHGSHHWFANLTALGLMVVCRQTAGPGRWNWAEGLHTSLERWWLGGIDKSMIVEVTALSSYFILTTFLNRVTDSSYVSAMTLPWRQFVWGTGIMVLVHLLWEVVFEHRLLKPAVVA